MNNKEKLKEEKFNELGVKLAMLIKESYDIEPNPRINPMLKLIRVVNESTHCLIGNHTKPVRNGMANLISCFIRNSGDLKDIYNTDLDEMGFAYGYVMKMFNNMDEYLRTDHYDIIISTLQKEGIDLNDL